MATIKSYTDLQQSKKLAEILPTESADNYYSWHDERYYVVNKDCPYPYSLKEKIPCWSLASLLKVLPEIQGGKPIIALDDNYITYPHMSDLHTKADNPIDACVDMIIKLHEMNLL